MKLKFAPLALAAAALSVPVAATMPASTAHAATCYGGSTSATIVRQYSADYTTSTRCRDINYKITSGPGRYIAVCWAKYGTCQTKWTWVPADGRYHVVATDVKNYTRFYFTASTSTTIYGRQAS